MHLLPPLPPVGSLALRRTLQPQNDGQAEIDVYIGGGGNIPPSQDVINREWPMIKDFYDQPYALTTPLHRERYNTINNMMNHPSLNFRSKKSPKKTKNSLKKTKNSPKKTKNSPKKAKKS